MNKKTVREIFLRFDKKEHEPKTELNYHSDFELLVAVILSAQATDVSVNKATEKLFKIARTPKEMLALGEASLKTYIKSIGLYQTKAKRIIATSKLLLEKFHGKVPADRDQLESLPGVGRKTANVVLNALYKQATIAVDTHVFRVANRIGLVKEKTPLAVENQLLKIIPKEFIPHVSHWLILHGRYVCTARKPKCPTCFIKDLCEYPHKTKL